MNPLRVLTLNVRYGSAPDGPDAWPHRRAFLLDQVRGHAADLIGLQEPDPGQWAAVRDALGNGWRGLFGESLDARRPEAHGKALLWRADRFTKLGHGVFWISGTPDVPGSILEPNQWGERTGAWVTLRDGAARRDLCFCCTHFDTHPGCSRDSARIFAAELGRAAEGLPTVAVGDFNAAAGGGAWAHLTGPAGYRDAWLEAGHREPGAISFNAFVPVARQPEDAAARRAHLEAKYGKDTFAAHHLAEYERHRNERMDWILLKGPLRATAAAIDASLREGRCASDHFAVVATLAWRPPARTG